MLNIGGKFIPKSMLPMGAVGATGFEGFESNLGYGTDGRGNLVAPQTSMFGNNAQINMSNSAYGFFSNNGQY
jgi:hypothetical protein